MLPVNLWVSSAELPKVVLEVEDIVENSTPSIVLMFWFIKWTSVRPCPVSTWANIPLPLALMLPEADMWPAVPFIITVPVPKVADPVVIKLPLVVRLPSNNIFPNRSKLPVFSPFNIMWESIKSA